MVKLSRSTFSTLLILLLRLKLGYACRISEFPCRGSSLCLPLDKYCDGRDDCGDATDEPKFCTGKIFFSIFYTFFFFFVVV